MQIGPGAGDNKSVFIEGEVAEAAVLAQVRDAVALLRLAQMPDIEATPSRFTSAAETASANTAEQSYQRPTQLLWEARHDANGYVWLSS